VQTTSRPWPDVLKRDLAAFQGDWEVVWRDASGNIVKRMLKSVRGTKEHVTRWGRRGEVLSESDNDFVLELEGDRHKFQVIKDGVPGLRYSYSIEGDQFVEMADDYTTTWTRKR
jgi:hypothetical protein